MEEQPSYVGSNPDRISETIQVSRVLRPNPEEQAFHHHLTLGIEDTLQAHPLIKDIKMIIRPPVLPPTLIAWERKYKRRLPIDLKNYYYSTNGFRLTWSLDYGGEHLRIGEMSINSLNQLIPLEPSNDASTIGRNRASKSLQINASKGATGGQDSTLKITFSDLQKMKCESLAETSKAGNKHNITSRSLLLPIEGQAFQLDSSKQSSDKGIVCLVYLSGTSKISQANSHHHQTPKKKFNKIRMSDTFNQGELSESMNKMSLEESSHGFSSERLNKSIEELEEEYAVVSTNSSFISSSDHEESDQHIQIWFLDPSFQWHFLAPTFSHYYRMLLYHLGLPEWEYRFTPFGVSSWAEQIFWLVAPHLLHQVRNHNSNSGDGAKNIWSTDYPAEAGKPNPVSNVINMNLFRKKKKDKKLG